MATSESVFLRNDSMLRPFQQPYTGPNKAIIRQEIMVKNRLQTVGIDRLKPAYGMDVSDL